MRTRQIVWNSKSGWTASATAMGEPSLVLYFGTREALASGERYEDLRRMFPAAHVLGCSTGGQINNNDVNDDERANDGCSGGNDGRICQWTVGTGQLISPASRQRPQLSTVYCQLSNLIWFPRRAWEPTCRRSAS